jgi:hypothetical protein
VPEEHAVDFLKKLFQSKTRFYALNRAFMSNLKDMDEEAHRIFDKHKLVKEPRIAKDLEKHDKRNPYNYIFNKFMKNQTFEYPSRTLVILDDAAGSALIQNHLAPIVKIIKTCRHVHATFILSAQTVRDSIKDLKRVVSDIVLFKNVPIADVEKVLKEASFPYVPGVKDIKKYVMDLHAALPHKRSKLIINVDGDRITTEH